MLQNMSKQYLGRDFGNADGTDSDNIKPGMLNSLAEVRARHAGERAFAAWSNDSASVFLPLRMYSSLSFVRTSTYNLHSRQFFFS